MNRPQPISALVEAQALDETEHALGEFIQVSLNIGIAKVQMAMMLRRKAEELSPTIIIPGETETKH